MTLELPPLRRRKADLRLLTGEILARLNQQYGKDIETLEGSAFAHLLDHEWPGNIRELENVLERAYILTEGTTITLEGVRSLIEARGPAAEPVAPGGFAPETLSIKRESKRLEAQLIRKALRETDGNRTQAAKLLEISHRALLYKIKDYKIDL